MLPKRLTLSRSPARMERAHSDRARSASKERGKVSIPPPCLTVRKAIYDNAAMSERIIIERLEFYGHCGVTDEERRKAQLIAVDLELEASVASAALSDRLDETIDYAQVAKRLEALGTSLDCQLLEAMASSGSVQFKK